MPNRILRDWTDSESVDTLSVNAERFFTRLIMKADDYGRYNANIKFLKSTLFPLKTDVRETDIALWLTECKKCGLIALYDVASKNYLQIENFKQALRQKREKFPAPQMHSGCVADDKHTHSNCVPETKRNESEVETETEGEKKFFNEEIFLVPEMMKEWKLSFKNYPEKKENDFPALLQIAEFIAEKEKIDCDIGVIPAFKIFIRHVQSDDFYKDKSLQTISRKIQDIVIKSNNGHANHSTGNKSNRDRQSAANADLINDIRGIITG